MSDKLPFHDTILEAARVCRTLSKYTLQAHEFVCPEFCVTTDGCNFVSISYGDVVVWSTRCDYLEDMDIEHVPSPSIKHCLTVLLHHYTLLGRLTSEIMWRGHNLKTDEPKVNDE